MTRAARLIRKYGITEDQYNDLLRKQDNRCAVCKRPAAGFKTRLCVDHDHVSGFIRGLLCTHCNRYVVGRHRLGRGEDLLYSAFVYLTSEYPGWIVPPKRKRKKRRKKK